MMVLALLAAAAGAEATQPAQSQLRAEEQARATVRIISGERIEAARPAPRDALVREVKISGADGSQTSARLIEFP